MRRDRFWREIIRLLEGLGDGGARKPIQLAFSRVLVQICRLGFSETCTLICRHADLMTSAVLSY